MRQEDEQANNKAYDGFKQRVFASAFGSLDSQHALKQYYDLFEKQEDTDYQYEEWEPENEQDVQEMLNAARRLGIVK